MWNLSLHKKNQQKLVNDINEKLEFHGLSWEDICLCLYRITVTKKPHKGDNVDSKRLIDAARTVIVDREIPKDFVAFKCLSQNLIDLLKIELPIDILDSNFTRFLKGLRFLFSSSLLIFVCYIVLGGLFGEKSNLIQEINPLKSFTIFIVLVIILASFEGLQIAVTVLRMKDVERLRKKYPRGYLLHRKFRYAEETNKFLAGRQLFVIVVVFFAAQLTSFPEMTTWPIINVPFPQWMTPWFQNIFLKLGILGAFLVLWTGQLAPQFVANKDPLRFINLFGVNVVYKLAMLVESMGLTKPGSWLAKKISVLERIPPSLQERYQDEIESIKGYGTVGIKKIWHMRRNEATLNFQNAVIFTKKSFHSLEDNSLLLKSENLSKSDFKCALIHAPNSPLDRAVEEDRPRDEPLGNGWKRIIRKFEHTRGPYRSGDVLLINAEIAYDIAPGCDQIAVLQPSKYILFRVKFIDDPQM